MSASRVRSFVHAPAMASPDDTAVDVADEPVLNELVPNAPLRHPRSYVAATTTIPYVHSNAFALSPGGTKRAPLPPPNRPFFGGHYIAEAGAATCTPAPVALLYRIAALAFAVIGIVYAVTGGRHLMFDDYGTFAYFFFLAALSAVVLSSLTFCLSGGRPEKTAPSYIQGSRNTLLANLAVPLYQLALTAALFFTPIYWAFLHSGGFTLSDFVFHLLPCAVLFLDYCLSMRMRFKLFYAFLFMLTVLAYLVALWVHVANGGDTRFDKFDHGSESRGKSIAYYAGTGSWAVAVAILVYFLSALFRWLGFAEDDEIAFLRDKRVFGNDSAVTGHPHDQSEFTLPSYLENPGFQSNADSRLSEHALSASQQHEVVIAQTEESETNFIGQSDASQTNVASSKLKNIDQRDNSATTSSTAVDTTIFQPVPPAYPAYPSYRRLKSSSRSKRASEARENDQTGALDYDVEVQHPQHHHH